MIYILWDYYYIIVYVLCIFFYVIKDLPTFDNRPPGPDFIYQSIKASNETRIVKQMTPSHTVMLPIWPISVTTTRGSQTSVKIDSRTEVIKYPYWWCVYLLIDNCTLVIALDYT